MNLSDVGMEVIRHAFDAGVRVVRHVFNSLVTLLRSSKMQAPSRGEAKKRHKSHVPRVVIFPPAVDAGDVEHKFINYSI